ncbi:3-hydroxyacyl-CoA dehydrogenase NAD-binding domain-containing protein [Usitatibacter palustris]|uniref:3-hydroxyadipyl-CoA dehydrogenase n=1 Tax=Usitatibacter palustris TaxID=2732487 RepID=A0A6M4H723_9PROT|nr:3-hydroxyacyl-CoA dehydrogenase NAD-binding domain-containing protein [Usitatibacter palustris]QJR15330.1 3-hydroxyadipyl-CoA dehydrogenase [Usitatibacter palustris]
MKNVTAVIGGGTMGADIALTLARAGCAAHLVEPGAARRTALPGYLAKTAAELGIADFRSIAIHDSLARLPWASIDVVIEAIPEKLEVKRALFAELVTLARPDALLASNSSAIPISRIAEGLPTRGRMFGQHWFMPAHSVPLVEVVLGPDTDAALIEPHCAYLRSLGKRPVVVKKDLPGFIANRLQHALCREAYSLLEQGVASAEDIDAAVRFSFGFRYLAVGPILQRDHAGLDVHCSAAATMYPTLADNKEPAKVLRDLVAAGHLGIKTGRGFYEWTPEKIAADKARYTRMLQGALALVAEELDNGG